MAQDYGKAGWFSKFLGSFLFEINLFSTQEEGTDASG